MLNSSSRRVSSLPLLSSIFSSSPLEYLRFETLHKKSRSSRLQWELLQSIPSRLNSRLGVIAVYPVPIEFGVGSYCSYFFCRENKPRTYGTSSIRAFREPKEGEVNGSLTIMIIPTVISFPGCCRQVFLVCFVSISYGLFV